MAITSIKEQFLANLLRFALFVVAALPPPTGSSPTVVDDCRHVHPSVCRSYSWGLTKRRDTTPHT